MRLLLAGLAGLLVAGCAGTRPYTTLDLRQVTVAYTDLQTIYPAFKSAYASGNTGRILTTYRQSERACRVEDKVDRRDSIDPNTALFTASSDLDGVCNTIDSAYAGWAEQHGYTWNKRIVPERQVVFAAEDLTMQKIPDLLRHPAAPS